MDKNKVKFPKMPTDAKTGEELARQEVEERLTMLRWLEIDEYDGTKDMVVAWNVPWINQSTIDAETLADLQITLLAGRNAELPKLLDKAKERGIAINDKEAMKELEAEMTNSLVHWPKELVDEFMVAKDEHRATQIKLVREAITDPSDQTVTHTCFGKALESDAFWNSGDGLKEKVMEAFFKVWPIGKHVATEDTQLPTGQDGNDQSNETAPNGTKPSTASNTTALTTDLPVPSTGMKDISSMKALAGSTSPNGSSEFNKSKNTATPPTGALISQS